MAGTTSEDTTEDSTSIKGIKAAADLVIHGGTIHVTASGDGIDANGTLTISGGFTTVCGPTQGGYRNLGLRFQRHYYRGNIYRNGSIRHGADLQ